MGNVHYTATDGYQTLCGRQIARRAGDPQGHWWWTETGVISMRRDCPPYTLAEYCTLHGGTPCSACAEGVV